MAATVMARLHLSPDDTILVGDRLLTDVRMARQAGMHAALVLSGATHRDDVPAQDAAHPDAPDFVLDDVTQLIPRTG
jgi:ribonucleotide monophosphatase NagD (HAD superfamily)